MKFDEIYKLDEASNKKKSEELRGAARRIDYKFRGLNGKETLTILEGAEIVNKGDIDKSYNDSQIVVLPKSLKDIGGMAFYKFSNLEDVIVEKGNNLTNIYANSFQGCISLGKINGNLDFVKNAKNLRKIGKLAFTGCDSIKTVEFPASLEVLDRNAFFNCKNLEEIKLNKGLRRIEEGALNSCKNLGDIVVPKTVKIIGEGAFSQAPGYNKYHITFESNGKYPLSILYKKEYPLTIEDLNRIDMDNIDFQDDFTIKVVNDLLNKKLELSELLKLNSKLLGTILCNFVFVRDNLFENLIYINSSDFDILMNSINMENVDNMISIFRRIDAMKKNSNSTEYIARLLNVKGQNQGSSTINHLTNDKNVQVSSDLIEQSIQQAIELFSFTPDEYFDNVKDALESLGFTPTDDDINYHIQRFTGNSSASDELDARLEFDKETDGISSKKDMNESVKMLFRKIYKSSL